MEERLSKEKFEALMRDVPFYTRSYPGEERVPVEEIERQVMQLGDRVDRLKGEHRARREALQRMEREALRMVIEDLREKGASDTFIQKNMYRIKERVHTAIYE